MGPVFVPKELVSYEDAAIKLWINEELMSDARTSEMLWGVEELLMEISRYTTLEPGDCIFTGAHAGWAKAHGGRWLQVGDRMRVEIERVGVLEVGVREDD